MTRMLIAAIAVIALTATTFGAQERTPTARTSATASTPVNLNTASAAQLEAIPGVGPAMAERIIQYREKNGSFKKIEDLMNVRGVGEKSFLKMKALITVTAAKPAAP